MMRVVYALIPLVLASIYFFGWRSLLMTCVVLIFGIGTEALFTFKKEKPVTSAVFVTCLIFSLSLPPTVPLWMAVVGIVAGVAIGKMMFGGFGLNVFNPAMVGRCFIYITFPLQMTNQWIEPFRGGLAGLSRWSGSIDAICTLILRAAGLEQIPTVLSTLAAGSFLFGAFFVATEPVSGAKTKLGQWIYGLMIGILIVVLRGFSNFSEGIMFSVLIMNAFVPLLDQTIRQIQGKRKAKV